jgi:hypothetical protein
MLVGSGPTGTTRRRTGIMRNWKTQRQRLGEANPTSKKELRKIVEAYKGPIEKLPMMPEEMTETEKLWALFKRKWRMPTVVELPQEPGITRRV